MPRPFKATAEQEAVIDAVVRGGDLKIKAYAGAGKTSTLGLVANHLAGSRGSYLAFNREIAEHARRRFPQHVSARTMNSVACASVLPALRARIGLPPDSPHELAARYGLGAVLVPTITGRPVEVTPFELGRMVIDGLGRFCRSADPAPTAAHIPVDEKVHETAVGWLRDALLPYVVRLWKESISCAAQRRYTRRGAERSLMIFA